MLFVIVLHSYVVCYCATQLCCLLKCYINLLFVIVLHKSVVCLLLCYINKKTHL